MSVVIRAINTALPGQDGIRGNVLTGQDILDHLLGYRRHILKWFNPRKLEKLKTFVKRLERVAGIEARNILNDPNIKFPNTYLAVEAGRRTLDKAGISPDKIQGFIFASDTSDFVFPSPGIAVAKLLEINPSQFVNCTMACISIADALINACTWMEKGLCDNVLVLAGDVTSRLRLPRNRVEPFIFGDGFVGMYLEKGKGATESAPAERGGFTFSNMAVDTIQADLFVHRHVYPSEVRFLFNNGILDNFQDNDTGVDLLGNIESKELVLLLLDFLHNTSDVIGDSTKLILPQTGKATIQRGLSDFESKTGVDVSQNVVGRDTFRKHGNIGAGAVPLAWHEAKEAGEIGSQDDVIFVIAGVGGVQTVFKYDPNARANDYFTNIRNTERPDYEALIKERAKENVTKGTGRKISNGKTLTSMRSHRNNGSIDIAFEPVIRALINPPEDIKGNNGEKPYEKLDEKSSCSPKGLDKSAVPSGRLGLSV